MSPNAARTNKLKEEIKPVIEALRKGLGESLIAVVLFGSRARGDATPASDWDLLVITRDLPARHLDRYRLLKAHLPPTWRGRVSILTKTPTEFEATLPPLYLDIALDGVILYDPSGYARMRLQALRRLIEIKGLRREKRGHDLIWTWQTFPGLNWSLGWEEVVER
ncbi:MAG: nucleotidyltransferase domain-containing protein [Chloroflexi bacterium]|nr:MAG: nucleotidyltransferase domain-containing protein [Chloroflexota bacterium]